MAWYAAHAIMYFKLKSGTQDVFTVWENVYLIEASDGQEAWGKAEAWANEEASYKDESLTINGLPAEMLFAGIRKIISVSHWDQANQLRSKDELTYSEFQVADEDSVRKLARGEEVAISYIE